MKTLAITAAAFGLAASAAPALAGPAMADTSKGQSIEISTRGLDLATAEGQEMLDRRIERAAKSVCNVNTVRTGTRIRSPSVNKCLIKARASAKSQVAAIVAKKRLGG